MPSLKAKANKNTPVRTEPATHPGRGVAKCLVWPDGSAPPQPADGDEAPRMFLMKKGEVGKAIQRGYELPQDQPYVSSQNYDETALQALRGWPGAHQEPDELPMTPIEVEKKKPKKKTKKGEKESKYPNPDDEDGQPFMGDLIRHKYLAEFVAAREAEDKRQEMRKIRAEQRAQDQEARAKEIKPTRTSQLRSIANAPKMVVPPKEQWQMSRFSNAQPHLTTVRRKQDPLGGEKGKQRGSYDNGRAADVEHFVVFANNDPLPQDDDDSMLRVTSPKIESPVEPPKDGMYFDA